MTPHSLVCSIAVLYITQLQVVLRIVFFTSFIKKLVFRKPHHHIMVLSVGRACMIMKLYTDNLIYSKVELSTEIYQNKRSISHRNETE